MESLFGIPVWQLLKLFALFVGVMIFMALGASILMYFVTGERNRKQSRKRHQAYLRTIRADDTFDTFARSLEGKRLPEEVVRSTYEFFATWGMIPRFKPHPEDSLTEVYGIYLPDGPDIDNVVREIAHRCDAEYVRMSEDWPAPRTVEDLVKTVARLYRRPDEQVLLRPANGVLEPSASLLRSAAGKPESEVQSLLRSANGTPSD